MLDPAARMALEQRADAAAQQWRRKLGGYAEDIGTLLAEFAESELVRAAAMTTAQRGGE